jgi:hypothetical protein
MDGEARCLAQQRFEHRGLGPPERRRLAPVSLLAPTPGTGYLLGLFQRPARTHPPADICGDIFLMQKIEEQKRLIAVLSDGLGHGVKAGILSTMTASMALKFIASDLDIGHPAELEIRRNIVKRVAKVLQEKYLKEVSLQYI